jgi:hypothetical protein
MASNAPRTKILVLARPAREHGADFVDRDSAAERLALRLEPVAHLAVEIGQRQAANAAFRRRADLRGVHQRVPEPLAVDLQVLHVRKLRLPVAGQGPCSPDFMLEPSRTRQRHCLSDGR